MSKTTEHNPIRKLADNPTSKAQAIKAMCAHCMGCTAESIEPGFRQSISACMSKACPLHSVRPYRANSTPKGPFWAVPVITGGADHD